MNEYLRLKKSNCKNCYKCIRHCPVKSIRFSDNQAHIVGDECILCGQCFVVCPQNAKEIRCDLDRARALLASGRPVYASLAPSFAADFPGVTITAMQKALSALGFAGAEETAVGATMVKKRYEEILVTEHPDVLISSCCHSVNLLIRRYFPEALPYLAAVRSPMQAHCVDLKRRHPGAAAIFIGPCISKKAEADEYPDGADCVLTFEELNQWLAGENITFEDIPDPPEVGGRARLFPTSGGILRSMHEKTPDYTYLVVDGQENCIAALQDVIRGDLKNCFIEMSACSGSCVGGPAMGKNHRAPVRDFAYVDRYAQNCDFPVDMSVQKLHAEHSFMGLHHQKPGQRAIEEVLHALGKMTPEQELNCGSCGYNTCREKAEAVVLGKADLTMCLPYLKEKAESFSDKIIGNTPNAIMVLNEDLIVEQINKAALNMFKLRSADDILHGPVVRMLDPTDYLNVVTTGRNIYNKCHYVAEYKIFVEETILYDKQYRILISIMRDVTDREEMRKNDLELRRQTVEITDKVIDKQMRVVQEIASLLGETTAETKVALTKLKDALKEE